MTTSVKPTNITFAYDNLVYDATTITPSTEVATMLASNLRLQERGAFWRSTDHTSETIKLTFSAAKLFKLLALVDHNLSATATIRVQANSSDSFGGTTPYDETFHVDADLLACTGYAAPVGKTAVPLSFLLNYDTGDAFPNYRYVLITFADPDNTDGYIQIGVLWLSDYLESERQYKYGAGDMLVDPSTVGQSMGGQDWPDEETMYMQLSFTIGRLTDHFKYYHFQQFFYAVRKTRFFILLLIPNTAIGRLTAAAYGRFTENTKFSHAFYDGHDLDGLEFKEVL